MYFKRILPEIAELSSEQLLDEILSEAKPHQGKPHLLLNMVSTVDGRATVDGSSRPLGSESDTEFLLELRAIADVVIIGVGTLRAEGYDRLVKSKDRRARREKRGLVLDPPAVLISRRFDIPWDAGLFASPDQSVLIFTEVEDAQAHQVQASVQVIVLPDCSPTHVLKHLAERGTKVALCEGGPTFNSALIAEKLVDELFLTISPLIRGNDNEKGIIVGQPLLHPMKVKLQWVLESQGDLFLRYLFLSS